MRTSILCAGAVMLLASGVLHAQGPKKVESKARFPGEAIEFFTATSQGYELGGKVVPAANDIPGILKAAKSDDPKIRDLGRSASQLMYYHQLLRNQKPDPEIAKIARAGGADIPNDPKKVIEAMVSADELTDFKLRGQFIQLIVDRAQEKEPPQKSAGKDLIEELLFTKPQEAAIRTNMLRVVGQVKALAMLKKMRGLVSDPESPAAAIKEPLATKLVAKNKMIFLDVTNKTKGPLSHSLIFTRAVNDPRRVEKTINMQLATRVLATGVAGASKEQMEAAKTGIQLESILMNLERGNQFYIPAIPPGATVSLPLMGEKDMVYAQNTEMSLWSDELAVPLLKTGVLNSPLEIVGTPIVLGKNGAATVTFSLTAKDPRDPEAVGTKMMKIFALSTTAGKTYTIAVTTKQYGTDLRVEDAEGAVQVKSSKSTNFKNKTIEIEFTPRADGDYRIVCSEAFSGPQPFVLTVQRK